MAGDTPDLSLPPSDRALWFLDGVTAEGSSVRRIPILTLPFLVGRLPGKGLTLHSGMISGHHAEIYEEQGALWVRDLGSTNGTSLNGHRLAASSPLEVGDTLHFAKLEFRVGRADADQTSAILAETMAVDAVLPEPVVGRGQLLQRMMRERSMTAVFQPIVAASDGASLGFECLGRGELDGESIQTSRLFEAATTMAAEAELSRLLREESIASCRALPAGALFINTHPREIGSPQLLPSLAAFRRAVPDRQIVVEIHEGVVTGIEAMCRLHQELADLGLELAYDDFGAGQARLLELAEAPPAYLKFDISLVRDLATASAGRKSLAAGLVAVARELGISTIAEGVESQADAVACSDAGFDFVQGYHYGRPVAVAELGPPK